MILNTALLTNIPEAISQTPKKKAKNSKKKCPNCGGPFFSLKTQMCVCGFSKSEC